MKNRSLNRNRERYRDRNNGGRPPTRREDGRLDSVPVPCLLSPARSPQLRNANLEGQRPRLCVLQSGVQPPDPPFSSPTVRPSDRPTARSNRVYNLRILPGSGRRLTLQAVGTNANLEGQRPRLSVLQSGVQPPDPPFSSPTVRPSDRPTVRLSDCPQQSGVQPPDPPGVRTASDPPVCVTRGHAGGSADALVNTSAMR